MLSNYSFLDRLIVRCPTPLAPYFSDYFVKKKIYYMVVGDYLQVSKNLSFFNFRNLFIKLYLNYYESIFNKKIKDNIIIVNSHSLYNKYSNFSEQIKILKTTTVSEKDIYVKDDNFNLNKIRLLYTGRIDLKKGLKELIIATSILSKNGYDITLSIAGWEDNMNKPIEKELISIAKKNNVLEKIRFEDAFCW